MASESKLSVNTSFSADEDTSRPNPTRMASGVSQEETINKEALCTGNSTAPGILRSLSTLDPRSTSTETIVLRNATKLDLNLAGQGQRAEDRPPNTPERLLSRERGPLLTPATPVPVVSDMGPDRLSIVAINDGNSTNDHQTGQDLIALESAGSSVERSLTACPAFDPEPLENLIAEHRTATVKTFHDIIHRLDTVNAELQWMLSEFLTQHYEQIEESLASNYKIIAQQEKDQGTQLLQEQIISFLNAMKSAFAIFGGEVDS
ncbi:hypothetical protein BGW39_004739 [Mortierella sp. 14UC]|nr:hypothetical protein BGW39_004739 [Mortierella sp. 14UC]